MSGAAGGTSVPVGERMPGVLAREAPRVEKALAEVAARGLNHLSPALRPPVEYALSTTGKRLRPVLCVAAYRAAVRTSEVPAALYRLACTLEIVHTYSLVHDDLPCMDDDDLRRGRPTVHRVFGNGSATLAGAALLPLAVHVLDGEACALGLDAGTRGRLVVELAGAAGAEGMVGGQLLDLEAEQREIDGAALEDIHRRKTGALLAASLRLGAIAGAAPDTLLSALTAYGEALGLAFQIADDLLDVEGDAADLGKTAGRDLALHKASYPGLYGIDGARRLARLRIDEAKAALGREGPQELVELADYVIERRK